MNNVTSLSFPTPAPLTHEELTSLEAICIAYQMRLKEENHNAKEQQAFRNVAGLRLRVAMHAEATK